MKKTTRWMCFVLCLLMLGGSLLSCKKGKGEGDGTTVAPVTVATGENGETAWETDQNGYIKDRIPEVDLGGREISVLAWSSNEAYLFPKDGEGKDNVRREVFIRNLELKARLNVEFSPVFAKADWGQEELLSMATQSGDAGYDLISSYSLWPAAIAQQQMLLNLNNYAFPDFEMPWWPDSVKEWEQHGSLFFAGSTSSIRVVQSMEVMFANVQIINDHGFEDPVDLVLAGNWTLEKMKDMVASFNGNAIVEDENAKMYGLVVDDHSRLDAFYYGFGFNNTRNDANGVAQLAFTTTSEIDKITAAVDRMINIMNKPEATIAKNTTALMENKKTAFMVCSMGNITRMEDKSIYAALPIPKIDESQETYKVINNNGYDVWCIPTYARDPDTSALIMEAFASSDYRTLAPYFYEDSLKYAYALNSKGAQVYDLIRSSVVYDFGRVSVLSCSSPDGAWRTCFWSGSEVVCQNSFASSVESISSTAEVKLAKVLDIYRSLKNRK